MGDLPGSLHQSEIRAISADRGTAVGDSEGGQGLGAVRWSATGGLVGLGTLDPSDPDSTATGVSEDGSVIVGTSRLATQGDRAYRWTAGGGFVQLGTLSCPDVAPSTSAFGVSNDGLTVIGIGAWCSGQDLRIDAVRWPGGAGGIDDIGDLPGPATSATAQGTHAVGSLIVGLAETHGPEKEAFSWDGSMHVLQGIAGADAKSSAREISADGTTIVGFANTQIGGVAHLEAVRWTGAGFATVTRLGALPGASNPIGDAYAASDDGQVLAVDPVSGTPTVLTSAGYIAGRMDVVVVPEPSRWAPLMLGAGLLAALRRWRSAK